MVTDKEDPNYGQLYPFALDSDFLDGHSAAERAEQIFNGRDDDRAMLLVNGRGSLDPDNHPEELPTVHVRSGVPEHWRLVNTANGRFMRVSIPGQTIYQIGTDGGLFEHPVAREPIDTIEDPEEPSRTMSNPDPELGLLLATAERGEIAFVPQGQPGDVTYLEWHDYPRGRHAVYSPGDTMPNGSTCAGPAPCFTDHPEDGRRPPRRMLRIVIDEGGNHDSYQLPDHLRDIPDIRGDVDLGDLSQALPITFGHMPPTEQGTVMLFSAVRRPMDLLAAARAATGPVPPPAYGPVTLPMILADPTLALWSEVGRTRYWEAVNFTGNDHPFHAHGFYFQPIETRYVDLDVPENSLPAGGTPWPVGPLTRWVPS